MYVIILLLFLAVGYWVYIDIRNAPVINEDDARQLEARMKEGELHQMINCLTDDEIIEVHEYVKSKLI